MSIKDELIFDFSMNMPRVLISGRTGILDNVKKILLISDTSIVVDHGNKYSAISGEGLTVEQLEEERMQVSGTIHGVEFYQDDKGGKNER